MGVVLLSLLLYIFFLSFISSSMHCYILGVTPMPLPHTHYYFHRSHFSHFKCLTIDDSSISIRQHTILSTRRNINFFKTKTDFIDCRRSIAIYVNRLRIARACAWHMNMSAKFKNKCSLQVQRVCVCVRAGKAPLFGTKIGAPGRC